MGKLIALLFIGLVAYSLMAPAPSLDATLLNNRALKLEENKKYDEALKLYLNALQQERINLTGNSSDMAIIYNNMAFLYEAKKEYKEALNYHSKALKLRADTLGKNHSHTIESKKNLNKIEIVLAELEGKKLVNSISSSAIIEIQKLKLNFSTHHYTDVLKNINMLINTIDKTELNWSEADRKYLKVYCYNFVLIIYVLLDDGDKIIEYYHKINNITVDGVSPKIVESYLPYTKKRVKKLFKSSAYYSKNYSEEVIDNVYKISEYIWEE